MKYLLVLVACTIAISSCNKDKKSSGSKTNPMCYWTVNGQSFQSNDTYLEQGKAQTNFGTKRGMPNSLGFTFWFSGIPNFGTYPISNIEVQDPSTVGTGLYYQQNFYNARHHLLDTVHASSLNNKARLQFSNVWFKNYYNEDDSILVSCDFYAP